MPQIHELSTMSGNPGTGTYLATDNGSLTTKIDYPTLAKAIIEQYTGTTLAGSPQSVKAAIDGVIGGFESLFPNRATSAGIGLHNSIFRGKNLGSSISTAQNTAIKNRTYDDLFVGDYWSINGHTWRIAALDYYYNVGDTNFNVGNVIVVPDAILYSHQMAYTESGQYEAGAANTTEGGYSNSYGFKTGLNQARTIATTDFGSHVATHRIMCTNATKDGKPSGWAWRDSDGVELMNEQQVYGTRAWGNEEQNEYDVGTQKMQFPLFLLAPQFVNTRSNYWLQDVRSATTFASVNYYGYATYASASGALGIRPAVTLKAT